MTQAQHGTVVVLGSTNWDICMHLPRLPAPGDTVGGGRLRTAIGGNGANQAVACHLAEAPTQFISCIGDDTSAATIRQAFRTLKLDDAHVADISNCSTGTACIFVNAEGENCIGITAGANAHLSVAMVEQAQQLFAQAKVLLLQLETPLASVLRAAELAHIGGARVVLNPAPAPAQPLPDTLYKWIDVLTPNRGELAELAEVATDTEAGLHAACERLLTQGVNTIVVTLGGDGVLLATATDGKLNTERYAAYQVQAADTTAAGDVFNGYLAAQLRDPGTSVSAALQQAMAAAALSVTREGALPSIPTRLAVTEFRTQHD